jgi:tRNA pseudouridine38-40 synthase
VHAIAQILNFKAQNVIPVNKIAKALNSVLPDQIRVIRALKASSEFNSRYDIKSKEYEYLIFNQDTLPPFLFDYVWHVKPKINIKAMQKASRRLVGKHDFREFCAAHSGKTDFVRTIYSLKIKEKDICIWNGTKWKVISIKVKGNGFLYKMVRNIVGMLVDVGTGKKPAKRCAPSQGLCLVRAEGPF